MERVHVADCHSEIYTANISKLKESKLHKSGFERPYSTLFCKDAKTLLDIPLINLLKPWCAETQYRTCMMHFSS